MQKQKDHRRLDRLLISYRTLPLFLRQHSERVAGYSLRLARGAWESGTYRDDPGFTRELVEMIGYCAYWHDIGKAGISNELWELARPLTERELALIRTHPVLGAAIIVEKVAVSGGCEDRVAEMMKNCCLYHHEWWDGQGYPFGLEGAEIPLEGRIVAIADAYDSMTAERPYSPRRTSAEALEELYRCAGTQFDPKLVPVFAGVLCDQPRPKADDGRKRFVYPEEGLDELTLRPRAGSC